jgi:glyoxalase family protein
MEYKIMEMIHGLHHITAICGDPQENIDFYTGVLGLRLVKITVNYDDPSVYHLYYGDTTGSPGTALTFFVWPGAQKGRLGLGQAISISFAIPENSLGYWSERLKRLGLDFSQPPVQMHEDTLVLRDPDGIILQLVPTNNADSRVGWTGGSVSAENAIKGFHSVAVSEREIEQTADILHDTLGFRLIEETGGIIRYESGNGGSGTLIDIHASNRDFRGHIAVGNIHHIAWRTPDNKEQSSWRDKIVGRGVFATPIVNRNYFQSIYFREPGGVLFEIATDQPGFAIDEPVERLGSSLQLPPWMEASRNEIARNLQPLDLEKVNA